MISKFIWYKWNVGRWKRFVGRGDVGFPLKDHWLNMTNGRRTRLFIGPILAFLRYMKMSDGPTLIKSYPDADGWRVRFGPALPFLWQKRCLRMTDDPTLINIQILTLMDEGWDLLVGGRCLSCEGSTSENDRWFCINKQSDANGRRTRFVVGLPLAFLRHIEVWKWQMVPFFGRIWRWYSQIPQMNC